MTLTLEHINTKVLYNNLYTDYKAEVVALNLLKYRKDIDQIFFKRLGSNNRSFNKDVKAVSSEYHDFGEHIVTVETYREGIYDYLPEGVFHPPSIGSTKTNVEDVVQEIRKQKKQEMSARRFFQPFELEACYAELNALLVESDFDLSGESNAILYVLDDLWPILKSLDQETARVFAYLLPFFHSIRGSKTWFERCVSAFLRLPVQISFVPNVVAQEDQSSQNLVLSQFRLGISTLLSGQHLDGERNWLVSYGPVPYDRLPEFMPTSNLRGLLQKLYEYCMPASVIVEEAFITDVEPQAFQLSGVEDYSRLGFSTYI